MKLDFILIWCLFSFKSGKGICSFGEKVSDQPCSALPHTQLKDLSKQECVALVWASGKWGGTNLCTICNTHRNQLLGEIDPPQGPEPKQVCFNPFNNHYKKVTTVRKVTYLMALKAKERGKIIPVNNWLCTSCRTEVLEMSKLTSSPVNTGDSPPAGGDNEGGSTPCSAPSPKMLKIDATQNLLSIGLSPIEVMQRSKSARVKEAKRKMETHNEKLVENVCILFDLQPEDLEELSEDYQQLLIKVKVKLEKSSRQEKIQLLTLAPPSWSPRYTANYFGVSRFFAAKAAELRSKHGILAMPEVIHRKRLDDAVKTAVKNFFESGDNSRMLPGKKDKVSIGKGVSMQKVLLLSNLKELFQLFKKENPSYKIGFSTFCSLRPKWCVLAGSSGTHNVCVCKSHQNVKLLLHALSFLEDYRDIIESIVCDSQNRKCMLRLCTSCPKLDDIIEKITKKLLENMDLEEDATEEDIAEILSHKVEYQEWLNTDRTELQSSTASLSELIEKTARKLLDLIPHHYINIKQKEYLADQKKNLSSNKVIVLMDFSMNYTSTVQDAIQAHHWAKRQATVHPVVIYYKDSENKLQHKSMCFISDDLDHDTAQVLLAQKHITDWIKTNLPHVEEVEYMTDGCAEQYKNCKAFLNLCRHEEMFGLKARWSFFATSHGKSPCDGIGGTVKREATRASLQRPLGNQILDAQKLFEFCIEHLSKEILFIFLKKETLQAKRLELKLFGTQPTTVPGTRSFHCFFPIGGKFHKPVKYLIF